MDLEPKLGMLDGKSEYNLDGMCVFTLGQFRVTYSPMVMFLGGRRDPEALDETLEDTWRTCETPHRKNESRIEPWSCEAAR